jgi:hypothetical protein
LETQSSNWAIGRIIITLTRATRSGVGSGFFGAIDSEPVAAQRSRSVCPGSPIPICSVVSLPSSAPGAFPPFPRLERAPGPEAEGASARWPPPLARGEPPLRGVERELGWRSVRSLEPRRCAALGEEEVPEKRLQSS